LLDEIVIGESPVENYVVQIDGSLIVDRMYDVGFSWDEVVGGNYAL
jgi:hypothetical protein